eukprot:UN24088
MPSNVINIQTSQSEYHPIEPSENDKKTDNIIQEHLETIILQNNKIKELEEEMRSLKEQEKITNIKESIREKKYWMKTIPLETNPNIETNRFDGELKRIERVHRKDSIIFYFHIHKAGGTSFCELMKSMFT